MDHNSAHPYVTSLRVTSSIQEEPFILADSVTKTCKFDMKIVRQEAAKFGVEEFTTGLAIAFLVWNAANPGVKP